MSSPLKFVFPKPSQNPSPLSHSQWSGLRKLPLPVPPLPQTSIATLKPIFRISCHHKSTPFPLCNALPLKVTKPSSTAVSAGRSKKKPGGPSPGRIEGSGEVRRAAKENARRRSLRASQNRFYRRSRASTQQADYFTEEELEAVGLGYDRAVRFMSQDHPKLRHPFDWYKYGKYGPYSWRGIVVGPPIRGRFTDERVTLMGEVHNHEEFEEIEQFEMANAFSRRLKDLDDSVGLRHYWVFVRHPRWRATELPWQQWTLVSEVVFEANRKEKIDKWSLMGRMGNKSRALVTQCAAWMRPDIIYVKRPLYQCRFEPQDEFFSKLWPLLDPSTENQFKFEPQDEFFSKLWPLLDPSTENQFKFELRREENGRVIVEDCTYFGGLCKIVKVSPKSYVDDVVNAYQKLSNEAKSRCLEFLLRNHPVELLHPYTKEWKAKLEEMELGCDAPDESDDDVEGSNTEIIEWMEDDASDDDNEDYVVEAGEGGEDEDEEDEEEVVMDPEETQEYWDEQWQKALHSSQAIEELVKRKLDASDRFYKQQMEEQKREEESKEASQDDVDAELEKIKAEWKKEEFKWSRTRVKKGKLPPELFLKAAVRPFQYRNLVKEIVLMRHGIIDGDITLKS
ncbi:hypothetical protein HPP92_015325 [Vanilla planifolia]|uniref:Uncharacterized protein n=1 Tax=Vanilla planifolia TaxID=51239 RepID=A0A835QN54_VANPL|nr:hypothetical protein HPP92_015325 [Vanilla planifolia]